MCLGSFFSLADWSVTDCFGGRPITGRVVCWSSASARTRASSRKRFFSQKNKHTIFVAIAQGPYHMNRHTLAWGKRLLTLDTWQSPLLPVFALGAGLAFLLGTQGNIELWFRLPLLASLVLLLILVVVVGGAFRGARARRDDYRSGDSTRVQAAVVEEVDSGTAPQRLLALALAGSGDFSAARRALISLGYEGAEDEEVSLCARIVILAFEGQSGTALGLCHRLVGLPLSEGESIHSRRRARREGIVALARAVAGSADEGDYLALSRAARFEPALYWACRYGAAVACCVRDEVQLAYDLVKDAPRWPKESCFRLLHSRIVAAGLGRSPSYHPA